MPAQYSGGGLLRITSVSVVGNFQNPETRAWDLANPISLTPSNYFDPKDSLLKGTVYTHTTAPLPDGFYEYKYR